MLDASAQLISLRQKIFLPTNDGLVHISEVEKAGIFLKRITSGRSTSARETIRSYQDH